MLNVQEPLTIYTDKRRAMRGLRIRLFCICLPLFVLVYAMLSLSPTPPDAISIMLRWCLLLELPVLYAIMSRKIARQTKPIVTLSSQGMTINTTCAQLGFLRWDEIKDVYAYNFGNRLVGVTLHDPKTVYARIGLKRNLMSRMNGLVAPLYRPFGLRVAPINIPQEYLPMSADELLTQVQAYRSAYL